MKSKQLFLGILLMLLVCMLSGCKMDEMIHGKEEFRVKNHLEDVVLQINEEEFTLEDIGYYIANGESAVEAQAKLYNPDNPQAYWNKHTNGVFIKLKARDDVMDNFTRDSVLAIAAREQGIALTDEEQSNCEKTAEALYEQLSEYQIIEAGISKDVLSKSIVNAYLGQLYIKYRLENDGTDDYTETDWLLEGVCYNGLLSQYDIEVNEKIWEEVPFGEVTILREE